MHGAGAPGIALGFSLVLARNPHIFAKPHRQALGTSSVIARARAEYTEVYAHTPLHMDSD